MKILLGNEKQVGVSVHAVSRLAIPIVVMVVVVLIAALWTALIRVGWELPSAAGISPIEHGPLMVSGFLGTLISLERAVALKRPWTYLSPIFAGLGAVMIILGFPPVIGQVLTIAAGIGLVMIFITIYRIHPTVDVAVMSIGAGAWLAGGLVWLLNPPVFHAVPWWAVFLILTIAGERLELAKVLRPSQRAKRFFGLAIAITLLGLAVSLIDFTSGVRVTGFGLVLLALWLLTNDIARKTVRRTGLTRFIAACLLPGYVWMGVGGVLWIIYAPLFVGGMYYDAMLHTLFLGFVFSMIFGHAPIILTAVIRVPVQYSPRFYAHLALLHLSLILRIVGDLALTSGLQRWGGMLNVCAILLFLGSTILATRQHNRVVEAPMG